MFQELKDAVYWAAVEAIGLEPPPALRLPIILDFEVRWEKGRKLMDDGNIRAGMKAVEDGIAVALNVDDKFFVQGSMGQMQTDQLGGTIVVWVRESRHGTE